MNTAIILNGPPGVGKDTIAAAFADKYGYVPMSFKEQLFLDTANYFGLALGELIERHNNRELKEHVWHKLSLDFPFYSQPILLSTREALIFVSEFVIKKAHGDTYFGDAAVRRCGNLFPFDVGNFIFSDGGFEHETRPMVRAFKEVFIFQLHRDGCDWGQDSRGYVNGFANTYPLRLIDGQPNITVQAIAEIVGVSHGQTARSA